VALALVVVAVIATVIAASGSLDTGSKPAGSRGVDARAAASRGGLPADPPRWYSPGSLWNTPIGPHPRIAPNTPSLIAALEHTNGIGPAYDYTPAIWYATTATPTVPVRIDVPRCGARTVQVPIPAGAVPDRSPEGHMAIAQYGTGREWDFYRAQSPNRPPKTSVYYSRPCSRTGDWTAAKVITTNWLTGKGSLRGSVRGSGTPEGAGLVLPRDLQLPATATWPHAMSMAYRNTCSHALRWCPIVAPATDEDGTCTDQASCVPEGARFQLDPSINCDTWPSLQWVWQRQMCRTFQVYGGIVIDTNAGGPTVGNQWWGSLGSYRWPWLATGNQGLPDDLLPHFRVLAWR
jgi:hypothetical protein